MCSIEYINFTHLYCDVPGLVHPVKCAVSSKLKRNGPHIWPVFNKTRWTWHMTICMIFRWETYCWCDGCQISDRVWNDHEGMGWLLWGPWTRTSSQCDQSRVQPYTSRKLCWTTNYCKNLSICIMCIILNLSRKSSCMIRGHIDVLFNFSQ